METPAIRPAAEVAAEITGKESEPKADDPKHQREYTFELDYTDTTGKKWTGQFRNQILSILQRQQVGAMKARLAGGVPFTSLDPYTTELNEMIAHLQISLRDKPKWAAELSELLDDGVAEAIYEEVASHEAMFHGRRARQKAGGANGEGGDGEPGGDAKGVAPGEV